MAHQIVAKAFDTDLAEKELVAELIQVVMEPDIIHDAWELNTVLSDQELVIPRDEQDFKVVLVASHLDLMAVFHRFYNCPYFLFYNI